MRALVTGAAGFVGTTLSEQLLEAGDEVVGLDAFRPYYDPAVKRAHVAELAGRDRYQLIEGDLLAVDLDRLLDGIDVVFHLAAQPGVRTSWADGFDQYVQDNLLATQRILEALHRRPDPARLVYASSSSIYGDHVEGESEETDVPRPHSPYGVTKLAAEHLCDTYAANFGVPTVTLRYFTVYGPRQRPDMGMHRLVTAGITGGTFPLFGDGSQVRSFTYVGDVARATRLAAAPTVPSGSVVNVAGSESITMLELIDLIGELVGTPLQIERRPPQVGDVRRTGGRIDRARALLGWEPEVPLREGLSRQIERLRASAW